MTSTTPPTTDEPTFSALLRAGSRNDHEQAEHAGFVIDLFGGRLPVEAYAAMLGQLWFVYQALESSNPVMIEDPVAGPFVDPALDRLPALEVDLAFLTGSATPSDPILPATRAYVERLGEVGRSWPSGWVAHHYTRYLGDLSGGQAIRAVVQRTYGLEPGPGTSFYEFPAIADRRAFKDGYRAKLDATGWHGDEGRAVADEVAAAYAHNTAVFNDLGRRFSA